MPLVRIDTIGRDAQLGLWQMTEAVDDYVRPDHVDLTVFHTSFRLQEKLMEYSLLRAMTGRNDMVVHHEASGKPVLDGWNISISHTRGWGAVALSPSQGVAVDIEYYSDRVRKVVPRFIRPDEMVTSLDAQLINWSAKETAYKLLSEEDLQYFEMRLQPFETADHGLVVVEDLKHTKLLTVHYEINPNYVLTWATEK